MTNLSTNTSTRDVVFNSVSIINSVTGIPKELTGLWNTINIYEDMLQKLNVIMGSIELKDGVNIQAELQLHGNEYLFLSFNKPGETDPLSKFQKSFRIYKITEKSPEDSMAQSYVIHFCSEELIFSNQIIVSRSFKGQQISKYIDSICTQDLKINSKKMDLLNNFEASVGIQDFIIPSMHPFDAINLLTTNAFSQNYSPFFFFENFYGYNFLSFETLFKRSPLVTLNYSNAKLTENSSTAAYKNANQMTKLKFLPSFDILKNTQNLTYSGRLYTLDILRQDYQAIDYSVDDMADINFIDGKNLPVNDAKNRNEKDFLAEHGNKYFYQMTNKSQSDSPYLVSRAFRVTDTNVENTVLQRESMLNLLNNTAMVCTVGGNVLFTVGSIVEVEMPSFSPNRRNERSIDPFLSGKYMITKTRHVLTASGQHQTILTLNKNTLSSKLDSANKTSVHYRKARNS